MKKCDDFSSQTDRQTILHNIYIATTFIITTTIITVIQANIAMLV